MVVVLINAVFLFPDSDSFFTRVDCSVFGYSIGLYLLYWIAYTYRRQNLQKALAFTVVDNINQGIVLFDYADEMILHNACAERLLKGIALREHMPQAEFAQACGLREIPDDAYALQYDREEGKPVRCEFRRIRDRRGRSTGGLYVFTDISRDVDDVTGFEFGVNLRKFARENPADFVYPTAVAVFDIIGLGEVNRVLGRDVGDARIRALARTMRSNLPEGTAFFRGYEAQLIAVCIHTSESAFMESVKNVLESCDSTVYFGVSATVDSSDKNEKGAVSRNIEQALETAYRDLQTKKLLNTGSVRSQTLSSLVRALEETDAETEAHVRRTQKMGVALGQKLGLSDAELTDLQLLCLLHDIGKISVPLDILNKPGRLTEEEWAVLRTHPEKGYQIARTSDELKSIAEMILYHHERWDGRGYPEKLAGEQIPVLSRIIAIVDAYDAMVNDRSYRKALPPAAAQEEIRLNAGTQFDPVIAETFLALLAEQPDIALGEKTGSGFKLHYRPIDQHSEGGNTQPVPYSRYLLDVDDIVIEVDDRFERITGYTREEAVGKLSQYELIPPEDRAHYLVQVNNQFGSGSIAYLRHEILRRDGVKTTVICYGKRYYDSAVKALRSEILIFELKPD